MGVRVALLLAVTALATALGLVGATPASAGCGIPANTTEREAERASFARSRVVLEGLALDGPNASGALASPARFRVARYLKGSGPRVVRVETATVQEADGRESSTSELIQPRAGERWRIYAQGSSRGVLRTSLCEYSRRLGG